MNIKKVSAVFFSPTNSTKIIISAMTRNLSIPTEQIDITGYFERERACSFNDDEPVIFGVPVYGGRVPAPAAARIKNMHGNKTPAILVATYGNREYEDALLELKNLVEENGFVVIAAAAFITEHSIMHSVATGRPDISDMDKIHAFFDSAWEKLQNAESSTDLTSVEVKGEIPYKEYNGAPLKPKAGKGCTKCSLCVSSCPVNAIAKENPSEVNKYVCISCMRCIQICPTHSRKLNKIMLSAAEKSFASKYSARKEPETFL